MLVRFRHHVGASGICYFLVGRRVVHGIMLCADTRTYSKPLPSHHDTDAIARSRGRGLDSIIITQAFHSLVDARGVLTSAHGALHPQEGTAGLLWHRVASDPATREPWRRAFSDTAAVTGSPPVTPAPLDWAASLPRGAGVDGMPLFRPFKHRKFVERATGPLARMLPLLPDALDVRLTPATFDIAAAKALSMAANAQDASLTFDLHSFYTNVVPPVQQTGSAAAEAIEKTRNHLK